MGILAIICAPLIIGGVTMPVLLGEKAPPSKIVLDDVAVAVYTVAQLDGRERPTTGDFTSAATTEVRDAQGHVVLRGQFVLADEEDDDIERRATLEPTGVHADAAGDAEVEFSRAAPAKLEVEFSVRNLPPGAAFTFVIDGVAVATATTDGRGRAEVEFDVRLQGTAPR